VRLDIPDWDDAVGDIERWEVVVPTAADVVEGQKWKVEGEEVAGAARVVVDVAAVGEGVVDEIAGDVGGVEDDVVVVVAAAVVADHWHLASKQQEVRGLGTCQNKYRRARGATNAL